MLSLFDYADASADKMWTFSVAIAIVICCVTSNDLMLQENSCNIDNSVSMEVIFGYFIDQHFMTVVDIVAPHSMNLLVCTNGNDFRPVDIFNSIDAVNFGPPIAHSAVTGYPTVRGIFVKSRADELMNGFLEKLSNYNPRTKVMMSLVDADAEEAKEVLKISFERYNLLNAAVTSLNPRLVGDQLVGFDVSMCLYNPFKGDSQSRSPEFCCWTFNSSNLLETLAKMEKFQVERIQNLHGFPLKISIFEYEMKSLAVYDENGDLSHYTYPDGELMSAVAHCMNFTPVFITILDGPKYGYQLPEGSFTGSLGDVEYEMVDLAANPKLIVDYNTKKSVFLQPVAATKLFFIIQRRITSKVMMITVFSELDYISRIIAMSLFILFPIVYMVVTKIERSLMR